MNNQTSQGNANSENLPRPARRKRGSSFFSRMIGGLFRGVGRLIGSALALASVAIGVVITNPDRFPQVREFYYKSESAIDQLSQEIKSKTGLEIPTAEIKQQMRSLLSR